MRRYLLLILFFLSGISGLIYEVAWVRQASLTFGVSVYAYSAVLAAYMGHSEYKHTIKYLKFLDAYQRLGLVNFIGTHRHQR